MKQKLFRVKKFKLKPGEVLLFTLGNSDFSIVPTMSDLLAYRKLVRKVYGKKVPAIIAPCVVKGQVIPKDRKHKVYLNNLEYLNYMYNKYDFNS